MDTVPRSNPAVDLRMDGAKVDSHLVAIPLALRRGAINGVVECYVKVSGGKEFLAPEGTTTYSWVTLRSQNSVLSLIGQSGLWRAQVQLVNVATDHDFLGADTGGILVEHPLIKLKLEEVNALKGAEKRKHLENVVGEGYQEFLNLYYDSPLRPLTTPPLPSGSFRQAWLSYKESRGSEIKFENTRRTFQELKDSLKAGANLPKKVSNVRNHLYSFGNTEQRDDVHTTKDEKGIVIEKKTKIHTSAHYKAVEYPFLKPVNFKLHKKNMNALADKTASSVLQPIKLWVDSLGDVEEYSVGFILVIWRMLNIFKK